MLQAVIQLKVMQQNGIVTKQQNRNELKQIMKLLLLLLLLLLVVVVLLLCLPPLVTLFSDTVEDKTDEDKLATQRAGGQIMCCFP